MGTGLSCSAQSVKQRGASCGRRNSSIKSSKWIDVIIKLVVLSPDGAGLPKPKEHTKMQTSRRWITAAVATLILTAVSFAQSASPSPSKAAAKKKAADSTTSQQDIQQLKQLVQAQQQQLSQQNQ